MSRPTFRIDRRQQADLVVVAVTGQIDLCSSFSFREQLGRVVESAADRVVIDLSDVALIDSAGLSVLAGVARRFVLEQRELAIVCSDRRLRRVLGTTGLDRMIPVLHTVAEVVERSPLMWPHTEHAEDMQANAAGEPVV